MQRIMASSIFQARNHDDGYLAQAFVRFEPAEKFNAIHVGHQDVGQGKIEFLRSRIRAPLRRNWPTITRWPSRLRRLARRSRFEAESSTTRMRPVSSDQGATAEQLSSVQGQQRCCVSMVCQLFIRIKGENIRSFHRSAEEDSAFVDDLRNILSDALRQERLQNPL